jgi:hypothetical protein
MKNIKVESDNDQMSLSVDGVPLKLDHEERFIITKEIMTGVNITDLPDEVVFVVYKHLNGGNDDLPTIPFHFHRMGEKETVIHFEDFILTDEWEENISVRLFIQTRLGIIMCTNGVHRVEFDGCYGYPTISFTSFTESNTVDEIIEKAEQIIESIETHHKNMLEKLELYLAVESSK